MLVQPQHANWPPDCKAGCMLAGQWQNFKVQSVSPREAQTLAVDWKILSDNALQPAGYNAPELILPLLTNLGSVKLITVRQGPDLLLAFPATNERLLTRTWDTPLTASGLPHVSEGLAESAIQALINAQNKPLLLKAIPTEGKFFDILKRHSAHFEIIEKWQRAALRPSGTYEDWLQNNFDQKRRKEFKRQRSRLSEQGALVLEKLKPNDDPKSYFEDLLALESAGWKGKKGTAIVSKTKHVNALHQAVNALNSSGKLRFWVLKFNGKAIASLYAIVEGDQAWLGKIAYDESFAKYSPGVQLILHCTESFFSEPHIKLVDSSAIPDHPMIDRIWRDRIEMTTIVIGPASINKTIFLRIVKLERQWLYWRSLARDFYYKLRGVKRS